jgi:NAD/NADP transhydrogenase alpha subunit
MLKLLKCNFRSLHAQNSFFFSTKIGVPKETFQNEKRVSVSPEGVSKLTKLGYEVLVEKDSGAEANFTNAMYEKSGAKITTNPYDADVILKVRPPSTAEVKKLKKNSSLLSFLWPSQNKDLLASLNENQIQAFGMD